MDSSGDGDIMSHTFDPDNTWMFKSFTPKFGPNMFMGQLPGSVTELSRPDYKIVGPGYYHQNLKPGTNLKVAHMRDNGIERGDYRCGSEIGRISEMARNPQLGPGLYKADESYNIANPANWEGVGVLENSDVRFKPTPISDLDESINAEIEAGKAFRESPALAHDRKVWTQRRGPNIPGQRRGLLPATPAPHMRRSVTCPPDPKFFLKKGHGQDMTGGANAILADKQLRERYHDEFFNAQNSSKKVGAQPRYPRTLFPREKKLRDWKRREAERLAREAPEILHQQKLTSWQKEPEFTAKESAILAKSTMSSPSKSLDRVMAESGNVAKCAFDSQVERTVESVRSFCPHMTEMSKCEYQNIGPGCYAPAKVLETWNVLPRGYIQNKGFGSGSRGLVANTPRKPESYFGGASKRKRDKNLSMFATNYLRRSHRTPSQPPINRLMT